MERVGGWTQGYLVPPLFRVVRNLNLLEIQIRICNLPGVPEDFRFEVFLSHSTKDEPVREPAVWLWRDGLRPLLDEGNVKPGDSIPTKIEQRLQLRHSRVRVHIMSAHASGSGSARLEVGTFQLCDPMNQKCRFTTRDYDEQRHYYPAHF